MDKQIKSKKKAALKVKDKCSGCKYYSRRGAIRAHILEAHTEIDMGIRKETVETEISNMSYLQTVCTKKRFINHFRETHPEREIFKCKTCGYECIFKSRLMEHVTQR